MAEDFFSSYLAYATENSEVPAFFHRWSAISGIGALLGRNYHFPFGHSIINPNIYCMLIGSPGTRKSTAIKLIRKLLKQSGYNTFNAEKTSKEKFLVDLSELQNPSVQGMDDILEQNLFGEGIESTAPAECFIAPDEANDFFGISNIEFLSLLGTLWDWNDEHGTYDYRTKTAKSIEIYQPTISILAGNTPTGFTAAFPTEILGQGFFSRLILVYGEPNGKRITFPKTPSTIDTENIVQVIKRVKQAGNGVANLTPAAEKLLDKIYKSNDTEVADVRFDTYSSRRLTHLIKLCLIHSAASFRNSITEQDVISANTILTHTEQLMPKALGEFGKAKNSDVSHRIVDFVESQNRVVQFREIFIQMHKDIDSMKTCMDLIQNLCVAEKLQAVPGMNGFLAKRKILDFKNNDTVDFSILTEEERNIRT